MDIEIVNSSYSSSKDTECLCPSKNQKYMDLRIGIDIRSLVFTRAGINRYTENLIRSLLEIDVANEYALFSNTKSCYDWSSYSNAQEVIVRLPHFGRITEKIWEEILLPPNLKRMDVFHSPRYMLPKKKPCKFVVTVHDLAFKKLPHIFVKRTVKYFSNLLEDSIQKADKIIAVSHNTKEDLLRLFNVRDDKVEVIYEGVNENYKVTTDCETLEHARSKYSLPEKFILYVGTIEPRKNLVGLIKAFHKLKEKKAIEHRLVIAGGKGWLYNDVFEAVERLGLTQDIIFTGYVEESELPTLYNLSDLFVYPTLYEGFGLPVLEAMACGVPVICSEVSSLPEVAGNAAIVVNPYDSDEIAEAIAHILENSSLKDTLIEKGIRRASMFTWQETARETLNLYQKL
jgi:glycosyltransferase involved in cell wall biosynthesis